MTISTLLIVFCVALLSQCMLQYAAASSPGSGVVKLGTLDFDIVETTPVLFKGEVWRMESIRTGYHGNYFNHTAHLRMRNVVTNAVSPPFAFRTGFGSAIVANNEQGEETLYVFSTSGALLPGGRQDVVYVHWSTDMYIWSSAPAIIFPKGYGVYNTGVSIAGGGFNNGSYVLAIELGAPSDLVGHPFTVFFATTQSAQPNSGWKLLPPTEYVYTKKAYSACPAIRYIPETGTYYLLYLNATGGGYQDYAARSRDLKNWEPSVASWLVWSHEDHVVSPLATMPPKDAMLVKNATDINNSDVDFCQVNSTYTYINYSWGNQHDTNFLAAAYYPGSQREFLESLF